MHVQTVWFVIAWALSTLAAVVGYMLMAFRITEDLERDIPTSHRPSLRLWPPNRRLSLKELRLHSQRYPHSNAQTRWWITGTLLNALNVAGIVSAILWNSGRGS